MLPAVVLMKQRPTVAETPRDSVIAQMTVWRVKVEAPVRGRAVRGRFWEVVKVAELADVKGRDWPEVDMMFDDGVRKGAGG